MKKAGVLPGAAGDQRGSLESGALPEPGVKSSIVVPLYNEENNIRPLYAKIVEVMDSLAEPFEIVFVDDGSTDGTYSLLNEICDRDARVTALRLRRNFGQTAALQAGFDQARGETIVSLDGDLQHDPGEIPRFLAKIEEGYDLVSGWRTQRADAWLTRQLPSRVANWLMSKLSGVPIHDFGTTFKAYRRETLQGIRLYSDYHRFIPALASWSGAKIAEIPIKNGFRSNGKSNYGLSRTLRVLLDLISIKFFLDYSTKPLRFFGSLGILATTAGAAIAFFLLFKKLVLHQSVLIEHGPMLFAAMVLILSGIQSLSLGLLGEMISRIYHESQTKPIYVVRELKSRKEDSRVAAAVGAAGPPRNTRRAAAPRHRRPSAPR